MKNFLIGVVGNISSGVELFTRLMYSIDPVAAIKGAQSSGYYSMSRWSADDTLAFQTYAGISEQSRKDVARFLRYMNGGCSLLATDLECSKVEVDSNSLRMKFQEWSYKSMGSKDNVVANSTLEFMTISVVDVFRNRLRMLRNAGKEFGVEFGLLGKRLGVVLLMDHGGNEMKACITTIACQGENTRLMDCVACYCDKDTYTILKHTIAPILDASIGELTNHAVLVVNYIVSEEEGEIGAFDFVFVPKGITMDKISFSQKSKPLDGTSTFLELTAFWEGGSATFEKTDIGKFVPKEILTITSFGSYDLALAVILQGRAGHSSNKCTCCEAERRDWINKNALGFPLHSHSSLQKEAENNLAKEKLEKKQNPLKVHNKNKSDKVGGNQFVEDAEEDDAMDAEGNKADGNQFVEDAEENGDTDAEGNKVYGNRYVNDLEEEGDMEEFDCIILDDEEDGLADNFERLEASADTTYELTEELEMIAREVEDSEGTPMAINDDEVSPMAINVISPIVKKNNTGMSTYPPLLTNIEYVMRPILHIKIGLG